MSNPMAQLQEATIKAQCKQLRMPVIAAQFRSLAEQAVREKKTHIGYLEALLAGELEERSGTPLRDGSKRRICPGSRHWKSLITPNHPMCPRRRCGNSPREGIWSVPNRFCLSGNAGRGKLIF